MRVATAAERDSESALAVVCVCGRDREMMEPFEALFRAVWPAVEIVWAVDSADPVAPPSGRAVPCAWQSGRRTRAVLDAMADAAFGTAAKWLWKLDVDVAHLSRAWIDQAKPDSVLIGLQNGLGWASMLGMAFAIRREVFSEIHAGSDCSDPGAESDVIHRAVRRRHLNDVWLAPHRPKDGGIFCSMSAPGKAALYRAKYSLVHCGIGDRRNGAELLRAFIPD